MNEGTLDVPQAHTLALEFSLRVLGVLKVVFEFKDCCLEESSKCDPPIHPQMIIKE
ncbi:MAG: hypothetical protein R3E97_02700 [Candidatus Eisenbacteria bacterium]